MGCLATSEWRISVEHGRVTSGMIGSIGRMLSISDSDIGTKPEMTASQVLVRIGTQLIYDLGQQPANRTQ